MIFIESPTVRRKSGKPALTQDQFISKANAKHNNRYSYHKTIFQNTRSKVVITCMIHGDFKQEARRHLAGQGCPECNMIRRLHAETQRLTTSDFIEKSNVIHNYFYSYIKTEYFNGGTKVIITCPNHGDFTQRPRDHLSGQGCPTCCRLSKVSKQETAWLSSLQISNLQYQYQIHSHIHRRRFIVDAYDRQTNTVYLYHGNYYHGNPDIYDRDVFNRRKNKTMGEVYDETVIYEQQLQDLGYNLVVMWESDWKTIRQTVAT